METHYLSGSLLFLPPRSTLLLAKSGMEQLRILPAHRGPDDGVCSLGRGRPMERSAHCLHFAQ